jgi:hypothetical protein
MKLNVMERLIAASLLPAEGSFLNLKLLRVTKESLSFDDSENKKLNFRQEGEQLLWDDAANILDKDVNIGDIVTAMIVKVLKEMNDKEELKEEHVSLYEKFIN